MLYSALLQHALSWCLLSSCLASEVIDWLRSMGGTAQGLQLADFADMGRGLRCGERVLAESVVLDVPRELFFSGDSGNALALSFGADILLSDSEAIAFQLLVERAKGQLSTWAPYLDVLPRSAVLTPKAFSKSGFEALQDSLFVENNLQSQELTGVSASGVRGSLNLAVRKACGASEVSNIGACIEAHTSSKAWAWALSIIDSRALTFKGARHLIPVADLVNYKPHPHASTRRFASGDFFLQHHKLTPTSIKTLSDRTCELGAQFFEDYGDNPTTIYVEHHGFVPKEVNPFDCVPVSLPALNHDSNEHANRRIDMLKALGVRSMPPSCFKASLDEIDPNLRYFLWVIDMDMEQMEACIASIETSCQQRLAIDARINPSDVGQPSSDCEYAFTPPPHDAPVLVSSLLDVVAKHPLTQTTSMEDDTRTLSNGGLSRDVSLAVQFRRSRKALLSQLVYEAEGALDANSKPNDQSSMPKEVSVAASWNLVLSQNGTLLHPLGLRVQAFNSWAKSMNWPQLHIQAAVLASHGGRVGTIATKTLHKGEIYLEIPESSCLGIKAARSALGAAALYMDDFQALIFLLLKRVLAMVGKESGTADANENTFAPYLALLPGVDQVVTAALGLKPNKKADTSLLPPLLWAETAEEARALAIARLQGSALSESVPDYVASTRRSYEAVIERVGMESLSKVIPRAEIALSWFAFRWAAQTLDSRAIWWNGQRHLVPMLDLVNAADASEMPRTATVHKTSASLHRAEPTAVTPAAWKFESGDQLLEDYGQPNHVLFLYHGFALEPNDHDCVRIDLHLEHVPGTSELLINGSPEFDVIKQRLISFGFRRLDYTACVTASSSQLTRVYQFIAIKYGLPHVIPNVDTETYLALLGEVEDRLVSYDLKTKRSGFPEMLLNGELRNLRALRSDLTELASRSCFITLVR